MMVSFNALMMSALTFKLWSSYFHNLSTIAQKSHPTMTKVGSEPISRCVKLGWFHEDFEKQDLFHIYHFMSMSLECYLPLSSSHRMTSANNKIYANEQLLLVSQTPVFEFSILR